jgi:hypothetical protein
MHRFKTAPTRHDPQVDSSFICKVAQFKKLPPAHPSRTQRTNLDEYRIIKQTQRKQTKKLPYYYLKKRFSRSYAGCVPKVLSVDDDTPIETKEIEREIISAT